MRFSFFVSTCILLVSCLLTSALASTSFSLSNNIQVNQRNLTLYQQQQDQKLYHLNTITTDEPNTSPTLKRRLALVDSSSTTSSKDPIFALVIFVALSSLMF